MVAGARLQAPLSVQVHEAVNGICVFKFVDTFGLPIDVVWNKAKQNGLVPAWDQFVTKARKAGWSERNIRARILEAASFVLEPHELPEFTRLLDFLMLVHLPKVA